MATVYFFTGGMGLPSSRALGHHFRARDPRLDRFRDLPELVLPELRKHGEREDARSGALGEGQGGVEARLTAPGETLLLVDGDGIVGKGRDAARGEVGLQTVAVVAFDHVEGIDVTVARRDVREDKGQGP